MDKLIRNLEAVFIDRDGTIGGTGHFIHPNDFVPYEFSRTAIQLLQSQGIKIFGFTNQHRVSRGEASIVEFQKNFCPMVLMMGSFVHIAFSIPVYVVSQSLACYLRLLANTISILKIV